MKAASQWSVACAVAVEIFAAVFLLGFFAEHLIFARWHKKRVAVAASASLFKRGIVGSYHQVSAKHLDAYIDEFEWRFNGRDNPELFRDTMIRLLNTPKMEFKELIEKSA